MTVIQTDDQSLLASKLKRELSTGEKLLWAGGPRQAAVARNQIPALLFGLFFFGFSIFWIVTSRNMARPADTSLISHFWMFGIPFALFGLWFVLKPVIAIMSTGSTI